MSNKRRLLIILVALLALAGLTAVLQAGGGRGGAGLTTVEIKGGDADSIREFLLRTLRTTGPAGDHVTVYIGSLPDDLPFELPLPDDAQIIGSITHSAFGNTEVIFDTAAGPKDLVTFFTDALSGDAWQANTNMPGMQGGFVQQEISTISFCYNTSEAWVTVNSSAVDDGLTDAHIYIASPGDAYMCGGNEINMAGDAYAMLPELRTPEGVEILPTGISGGGGGGAPGQRSANMSVVLGTERPVADVIADYNTQLEAAGWTNVMMESGVGFAWSGWTFTDETGTIWGGTLTLTANPTAENQFNASITVLETTEKAG